MYKQLIIMRKDLNMSHGKSMSQCCHASMAFLTNMIRENYSQWTSSDGDYYSAELTFDKDLYEQWINGSFTKIVCGARNKNQLLKAVTMANELGLQEGKDFFLIKDNCYTELTPEETDENGVGRTLTCIGFTPLPNDVVEKISKKYHLYI